MKPECAQTHLVKETNQIVAPLCVPQLVEEHSVELRLRKKSLNAMRKRDEWPQKTVYCRTSPVCSEPDRYTMSEKTRLRALRVAAIVVEPQTQPRKHQHGAHGPHDAHDRGCCGAQSDGVPCNRPELRREPRDARRPEPIGNYAQRHKEIYGCRHPDPVFRSC